MVKRALIIFFLSLSCFAVSAQVVYGGVEYVKTNSAEIPFELKNDLIIVSVLFDQIFPLRFIFDTGAEHTILTRREITDLLRVDYQRKFTLYGADLSTELVAYLATGVNLELGNLQLFNRSILVLEEDYFNFDEFSGVDIHGIIGADIFRRFVVEIDYSRKKIIFYPREKFKAPGKKFTTLPIEIHRSRPYLQIPIKASNDSIITTKLLLDSGSSLPLVLYPETSPILDIPEQVIPGQLGIGLGGFLEGVVGRVQEVDIGGVVFSDVLTSFQDHSMVMDTSVLNNRNGILGNQMLQHFRIIIDYIKHEIYISPVGNKPPKFKFDRSGLFVVAGGEHLNEFRIASIVPGSPADQAGLQRGDALIRINWIPCRLMSLGNIQLKFKKRVGKKFRVVYERDGERYKTTFELRELI